MLTYSRALRIFAAAAAVQLSVLALAAGALGVTSAEQTRESYVAEVEPICKQNTRANEQVLAGVRKLIKKGQLKVAAGKFAKASTAFGQAVEQIAAVPQPPADTAKLAKWLKYLDGETKLLGEIGKALKAESKSKAQALSVRLTHNGNLANNAVLGFDFDYCLIESSRFS
jgi:hypothetical protein